jgi:hypothetical protein
MPTIQAFIERYTPMQIEMEPAGRNTKRESVRVLFLAPLRQSRVIRFSVIFDGYGGVRPFGHQDQHVRSFANICIKNMTPQTKLPKEITIC